MAEKMKGQLAGLDALKGSGGIELTLDERNSLWIERLWMVLIVGGLYSLFFREELIRLVEGWGSARESHGLLIPAFSLYFLYQDRRRLGRTLGRPSYWGLVLMVFSVLCYLWFFYIGTLYPRQVMMLLLLAGIVLFLGGWLVLRRVWLPIAFLIFAMPLPSRIYYNITIPMRKLASTVAAVILNGLPDIQAEASGVVISGTHLGEVFNLNVAEACSGMRLLQAFLALGVAMAYLESRPMSHRLVLMCSTIPIAIFCNMIRVLLTGLIHIYIGSQYATGMLHTLLGMAMLLVAFGLYGLLAWLMNRVFIEEEDGDILVVGGKSDEGVK